VSVLDTKIKPLTEGQKALVGALKDSSADIVGIFGPTGTGKSLLAVAYAYDSLKKNSFKRVVIAKPVVDVESGRELLMSELGESYREIMLDYLGDLMSQYISRQELEALVKDGQVQFADTHLLRGRTFDHTLVFLDDVQHVPVESVLEIVSRVGRGSRLIIAGDPVFQSQATVLQQVQAIRELLLGEERARVVDLGLADIVRPGAQRAVRLLLELKMRKRSLSESERKVVEVLRIYAPDAEVVTVLDCRELRKKFGLSESSGVPDYLVIVKQGHYGRIIGKKGERVAKAEEEIGGKLRVAEAALSLAQLVRAVHPLPWSLKAVRRADIEGNSIVLYVESGKAGPIIGQKGTYIRFVDTVMRRILGASVLVREEGG